MIDGEPSPAKALRLLRFTSGLSRKEWARRAGVRESALRAWESGVSIPGVRELCDLTGAMGLTLSALEEAVEFLLVVARQRACRAEISALLKGITGGEPQGS